MSSEPSPLANAIGTVVVRLELDPLTDAIAAAKDALARGADVIVVPVESLDQIGEVTAFATVLVDLGSRTDRAEVAALVAVALEAGASGFVSEAPTSVRRALQVIRAVESAT